MKIRFRADSPDDLRLPDDVRWVQKFRGNWRARLERSTYFGAATFPAT